MDHLKQVIKIFREQNTEYVDSHTENIKSYNASFIIVWYVGPRIKTKEKHMRRKQHRNKLYSYVSLEWVRIHCESKILKQDLQAVER